MTEVKRRGLGYAMLDICKNLPSLVPAQCNLINNSCGDSEGYSGATITAAVQLQGPLFKPEFILLSLWSFTCSTGYLGSAWATFLLPKKKNMRLSVLNTRNYPECENTINVCVHAVL